MADACSSRPPDSLPVGWRASIAEASLHSFGWSGWLETLTKNAASLPGYRQLKQGADTTVFVTDLRPDLTVVVKHTRTTSFVSRLVRLVRPSAEAHEFRMAQELLRRGIPTPQPLAWFEYPGRVRKSLLITRYVSNLRDLDQVVLVELPRREGPQLPRLKRTLAEQLARMIAAFQRTGFAHRDLKASNILVQLPNDPIDAPAVWLVDLKGVTLDSGQNAADPMRALTRLAASLLGYRSLTPADYVRFLTHYQVQMGLDVHARRKLYLAISRDAHAYNRRAKSRKGGKIDGYGGA